MQHKDDRAVAAYEAAAEAHYQRQLNEGDAADACLHQARKLAGSLFMQALLNGDERAPCRWAPTWNGEYQTAEQLALAATDNNGVAPIHLAQLVARAAAGQDITGEAKAMINQMISDWARTAIQHKHLEAA